LPGSVLLDVRDHVATITLNRPERRNAWTFELALELSDALEHCDADDDVRAVIVTGAGDRFSVGADLAGGDLSNPGAGAGAPPGRKPEFYPPMVRKPVIAALNGDAVGGGITFALLCDMRVLAAEARVGLVFVRRGVIPEMGAHLTLPRLVGNAVAAELIFTGRLVPAAGAATLGLCNRMVPAAEVLGEARRIATDIAKNSAPVAVATAKRLLWRDTVPQLLALIEDETDLLGACAHSPDGAEGVASFLERRPPRWTGRPSIDVPLFVPPARRVPTPLEH
jgi:enoyl-CoA hydratase/carnithine racemase